MLKVGQKIMNLLETSKIFPSLYNLWPLQEKYTGQQSNPDNMKKKVEPTSNQLKSLGSKNHRKFLRNTFFLNLGLGSGPVAAFPIILQHHLPS